MDFGLHISIASDATKNRVVVVVTAIVTVVINNSHEFTAQLQSTFGTLSFDIFQNFNSSPCPANITRYRHFEHYITPAIQSTLALDVMRNISTFN